MKFLEIYTKIKEQIASGIYPPNSYLPHTTQLTKQYSVSISTISNAMKLLKKDGLVQRIKSKGTIVLSQTIKGIASTSNNRIAILFENDVATIMNAVPFRGICSGIEGYLYKSKDKILLSYIPINRLSQDKIIGELETLHVSGVIFFDTERHQLFNELRKRKIAMTFCLSYTMLGNVNSVNFDYFGIAATVIQMAIAEGGKHFSFWGLTRRDVDTNRELFDYLWNLAFDTHIKHIKGIDFTSNLYASSKDIEFQLKEDINDYLTTHRENLVLIFRTRQLFEVFKSIYENNINIKNAVSFTLILIDWSATTPTIDGKKTYRLHWTPKEVGVITAKKLLSSIREKRSQPENHFIETSIETEPLETCIIHG
jgi:DNA-binding transcriptional regulator YhcF (GntR family)